MIKQFFYKGKKRQKKSQTFDHGFQEQSTCFLCGEHLIGDLGDINRHIDRCLLKSENPSRASSPPPDQFEDSFDYYTWGDETRIRPTSLLMGGLAGLFLFYIILFQFFLIFFPLINS